MVDQIGMFPKSELFQSYKQKYETWTHLINHLSPNYQSSPDSSSPWKLI